MEFAYSAPEEIRLRQIGITTHAYADTWVHQNFVGSYDEFDDMSYDEVDKFGSRVTYN